MNAPLSRPLTWFLAFVLFAAGAVAQDMDALRDRMKERLPRIDELKAQGVIGETHDGLLAVRTGNDRQVSQLVAGENADRKSVYEAIAKRAGASADKVAQARARQIAAGSASGVWLQDASGEWYRKP
ncbi:YdbL family protein [Actomonas aquatica]|uniref:YdbL family protein n=1 Tax=Actomonas aquatica TaxID=2866162 RepID=A0ABZ1CGU5_9BACT|nr:YdbL family protein [Opitutus sp. WL0086]WRQ89490.1 YdbL family protein [Opitutus sp. WL0086]